MTNKKCTSCGRELPATNEFFSIDQKWLSSRCKQCRNEYFKEYRDKNKEKLKRYSREIDIPKKLEAYEQDKERINHLSKLHQYIRKIKPKQSYCTICNQKKRLELASINHTYTKNIEDYLWLCRSCHILFDKLSEVIVNEYS